MDILELKPDVEDKSTVNKMIERSSSRTLDIIEYVSIAPQILSDHTILRRILRSVKRGNSLEDSIKIYAGAGCPPNSTDETECEEVACESCWKYYIEKYKDTTLKEGESENDGEKIEP